MHAICFVELAVFVYLIALRILGEEHSPWRSPLCHSLFLPVTSLFLFPNILFKISFSNSILFLEWENEFHTPIKQEVAYDFVF